MESITFHVNDDYRPWLATTGMLSFERLMFADIGSVMERNDVRDIRRIESAGKVAYLKRRWATPILKAMEMLLLDRRAHTVPFTEYLHVRFLQQSHLPVMRVIAAGEQRRLGFPRRGFILVDEVKGVRMDDLLGQAITWQRKTELLQSLGRLLARLHQSGFFGSVRLKDIVVTEGQAEPLVLIDREVRHPGPRWRLKMRARRALRGSFRRTVRDCPFFDERHMSIVMQSYERHWAASAGAVETRANHPDVFSVMTTRPGSSCAHPRLLRVNEIEE